MESSSETPLPSCGSMPESQRVAVRDLRLALDRLLAEVERTSGPEIDLAADPYWVVAAADAFVLGTPPTPTVGQLADDLESLAAQVADDAEQPLVWHDLEHVVGLLRRIAALDLPPGATSA